MTKQIESAPPLTPAESAGLVATSPAPLWVANAAGERTFFNPAWFSLTGREPSSECGFGWLEGLHPEDRERVERTVRRATEARTRYSTRYRLACRHDEWRQLEEHARPVLRDERLDHWIGVCRDTTQENRERNRHRELVELTHVVAGSESSTVALEAILRSFDSDQKVAAVCELTSKDSVRVLAAPSLPDVNLHVAKDQVCRALETRKPVIVADIVGDADLEQLAAVNFALPLRAMWVLPTLAPTTGALVVFFPEPLLPSDEQVEDLSQWTSLVSLALRIGGSIPGGRDR